MNSFKVTSCYDCKKLSYEPSCGGTPYCTAVSPGKPLVKISLDEIPDECPKLTINQYRIATKSDIGQKCYFSDMSMRDAVSSDNTVYEVLKKVNKDCFVEDRGVGWRFAFIKKEIV